MTRTRLIGRSGDRKEIMWVFILWGVLILAALAVLIVFNRNAVRIINHIEYVKAPRFVRMMALYEEGKKRADRAFRKLDTEKNTRLSASDPDYMAAVELYDRAFKLDPRGTLIPDHSPHYQVLLRLHEAAGADTKAMVAAIADAVSRADLLTARVYYFRLVEAAPQDDETWLWGGEVFLRSSRFDEATSAVARLADGGAKSLRAQDLAARIALAQGNVPEAIARYSSAIELEPDSVDIRKRLSELLVVQKDRAKALEVLLQGIGRTGDLDGNYMHRLGEELLIAGRAEEAVDVLTKAAQLDPQSADVQWSLARACLKVGNPRRANAAMQRAYELKPELRQSTLKL